METVPEYEEDGLTEVDRKLDTLAEKINKEHRRVESAVGSALEHARRAGKLLIEAKERVRHGEWLPWLGENFEGSDRVAQMYMRVHARWAEIEANTKSVSDLTLSGALKSIGAPTGELSRIPAEGELRRIPAEGELRWADAGEDPETTTTVERPATEREPTAREVLKPEDGEDYAKRVAEMKKRTREAEERYRRERRERHTEMFLEVDALLSKARRAAKEALDVGKDVEFDEEERELLRRQGEAARGVLSLAIAAITDDSGTDWDAELAKLEERRQWGE